MANIAAIVRIPADIKIPCFLGSDQGCEKRFISLRNGILDLEAALNLKGKDGIILPHSPSFFSTSCLPYDYNPKAKPPSLWMVFLAQALPELADQELLQEWFGYNLVFDTSFHKFMLLTGDGANGKGVVFTVLRCLLGDENTSAVGLEQFNASRTFPLSATVGKLANIVEEIGEMDRIAEGLIKDFVSAGRLTIERKHKDPFEIVPTARMTLGTNVLPRFKDSSSGIWRRMLLLSMDSQILDESQQDRRLIDSDFWTRSNELEGIFVWALQGLLRLRKNNKFTESVHSREVKCAYFSELNPTTTYLLDYCAERPGSITPSRVLYQSYRAWMQAHGENPLSAGQFASRIRKVFQKVELSKHPRRHLNYRTREWINLSYSHHEENFGTGGTTDY